MAKRTMTEPQRRMLEAAERAPRDGWDGASARGASVRTAEALTRSGLLRFAGWGMEAEGQGDGMECRVYVITDAGLSRLSRASSRGEP
jgi:hypothetical protein